MLETATQPLAQPITPRTVAPKVGNPLSAKADVELTPRALNFPTPLNELPANRKRLMVEPCFWQNHEARSGDAAAYAEQTHFATERKPGAGSCRWRSVRYHCTSPARCLRF